MKLVLFRVLSVILLLAVIITVFCFSAQPAEESKGTSDGIITDVIRLFYPKLDELSKQDREKIIDIFSFPVRKGAHFSAYFLMGLTAFLSIVSYKSIPLRFRAALSFIFCVLYAVSDEFHQHFVAGRSCELRDVIIDSTGALIAIILLTYIFEKRGIFRYEKR